MGKERPFERLRRLSSVENLRELWHLFRDKNANKLWRRIAEIHSTGNERVPLPGLDERRQFQHLELVERDLESEDAKDRFDEVEESVLDVLQSFYFVRGIEMEGDQDGRYESTPVPTTKEEIFDLFSRLHSTFTDMYNCGARRGEAGPFLVGDKKFESMKVDYKWMMDDFEAYNWDRNGAAKGVPRFLMVFFVFCVCYG